MNPIKPSVKRHYQQQQLSAAQQDALHALTQAHTPPKQNNVVFKRRSAVAAAVLLCGLLIVVNNFWPNAEKPPLDYAATALTEAVALEVANNHLKLKPLEVEHAQFERVSDYFTLVNFSPVSSVHQTLKNTSLLGGRYCSIQTDTAVQLRYQDDNGRIISVFEVGFVEQKFGNIPDISLQQAPIQHHVLGVEVSIWQEKGLLFAQVVSLAHP